MQALGNSSWRGWITLSENRFARSAADRIVACFRAGVCPRLLNPLFLFGPAGVGKSFLIRTLAQELGNLNTSDSPDTDEVVNDGSHDGSRNRPHIQVGVFSAKDLSELYKFAPTTSFEGPVAPTTQAADVSEYSADVFVVEDLQYLAPESAERVLYLLDQALATDRQVICTAQEGPARLVHLPTRLTSRLASGLVVGLSPLSPLSRRTYFRERLRGPIQVDFPNLAHVSLPSELVESLADRTGGSVRQLEGTLTRLDELVRLYNRPPTLPELDSAFGTSDTSDTSENLGVLGDNHKRGPTKIFVERILQKVGSYYQIRPHQLRSRQRGSQARGTLLARQVGMYLARQLTGLSLEQIGAYFGGRDHSTVLHACRKIEQSLVHEPALAGAIRQLHADLI